MQERERALREKAKLNHEVPLNDYHQLQERETTAEHNLDLEPNDRIQEHGGDLEPTTKSKTLSRTDARIRTHQDNHLEAAEIQTENTTPTTSDTGNGIWIVWKTFSIISLIHFVWKCRRRNAQLTSKAFLYTSEYMPSVDSTTLQIFHSRFVQSDSGKKQREDEFLGGFVGDLLQSIKEVCSENGGMAIATPNLEDLRHVIVPLAPPESYFFKCLYSNKADDVLLDMQMCGHIELVKNVQIQNGCPCQASVVADEMVCLLHKDHDKIKVSPAFDKLYSNKDSNWLSKAEVAKWFQRTLRQAWSRIAFKYEFELCIGNMPGALIVRFRSGEKIIFTLNPVIATDHHSYFSITPCSPKYLDTFWSLSLSKYEDTFLNQISKLLPNNSCHMQTLEIILFLHKRQIMLTGKSALEDFHYKIALMHLLLTKNLSEWRSAFLANRLQDLFTFMMYSLKTKQLHHVLIGNPQAKAIIQLPANLVKAKPVNLFHPLVVHKTFELSLRALRGTLNFQTPDHPPYNCNEHTNMNTLDINTHLIAQLTHNYQ
uniref:Inositol 1,4,5-trisphosphate receptor-interacting protein n=1 Tax=Neogobius melanostomus TaxID=47308 RepID=A0A8C6UQ44_9GOBI